MMEDRSYRVIVWMLIALCVGAIVAGIGVVAAQAADLYQPETITLRDAAPVMVARLGDGMPREVDDRSWAAGADATAPVVVRSSVAEDRSEPHLVATAEATYFCWGGVDTALTASAAFGYEMRGLRLEIVVVAGNGDMDSGPRISTDIAAAGDLIANLCGREEWPLPEDVRFVLAHITFGGAYLMGTHRGGGYIGFVPVEVAW